MDNISSCSCTPAEPSNLAQANWAYQSAQIAEAHIAGEQSTDIQIQTADGDKVTLSSDIKFESSAIVYEKLGQTSTGYSRSQGQIVSANASSELELTVEGTLDEQEKKEIKAVLMNLFKMVKDFLSGNAGTDTEEVQNVADLGLVPAVPPLRRPGPVHGNTPAVPAAGGWLQLLSARAARPGNAANI